jgi:ribokinase
MKRILVIGSSNTDMVVKTEHFPDPGETVLGGQFFMFPGGKGANQAIAAARLGGQVSFLAKLGKDLFGEASLQGFREAGINTDYIARDELLASGVALITVNQNGQNTIVVAPGANDSLSTRDIGKAKKLFEEATLMLIQLEIPIPSVIDAIQHAWEAGNRVVLNPAPARQLPEGIWEKIFLFTPNESEAAFYTGMEISSFDQARLAAEKLRAKGVGHVVVTMGSRGSYYHGPEGNFHIPALPVQAVDTTAAGDVFNGALCVALAEKKNWSDALHFASRAAAISVTRLGAQSSAPTREEVDSFND